MADEIIIKTTFLLKRGTAADWARVNPILMSGEPGIELDTMIFRIGDGINHWNSLPGVKVNAASKLIDSSGIEHTYEEIVSIAGLEIRSVNELPVASAETMRAIYLVPNSGAAPNVKDEYITIRTIDQSTQEYVYSWEIVGSTEIDLSGYAHTESPTFTGVVVVDGDEDIIGALSVGGNLTVTGNIHASNLAGGTTGQVLTKNSNDNYDFNWADAEVPKLFRITLRKNAWEEGGLQTVEHDNFFEIGYLYTVEPEKKSDMIQWIQCEISAVSVEDGKMIFMYEGTAPTADISLVIKGEKVEEETPSVIQACMFEGNILVEGDGQGAWSIDWAELTNEEVKEKIDEGYIPFYTGMAQLTNPSEEYIGPEKGFQAFTNIQHYTLVDEQTHEIDYIGIYAGQNHIFEEEKDINTGETNPNPNYDWFEAMPYAPEP
jgi:hypothetical protein